MATLDEIAAYRPKDIDEALDGMRSALDYFHRENDQRAIFLRACYLITLAVHQAIHERGRYPRRLFFDPEWMKKLFGKVSLLYFQSLTTHERPGERAWKTAHRLATARDTSIFQDMLLGLNAHINYDFAYALFLNLKEFGDGRDHQRLPRRKFDHDQVNNILVSSIPQIDHVLTRDYGGGRSARSDPAGSLEDVLAGVGLKYYRERVWWNAISYLSAKNPVESQLVRDRLDWESAQLAESVACEGTFLERMLRDDLNLFSKDCFGPITLEGEALEPPTRQPEQAVSF